jgi:ubiquinol-cytochrome c reductase cytochrome c1 subunit
MNRRPSRPRALAALALVAAAVLVPAANTAVASEGALPFSFKPDAGNKASLQRGAAAFMNYCSGCHGLKYLRYNRLGQDLGIPEDLLKTNLMFTSDKLGDHIVSAMPGPSKDLSVPSDSEKWFGRAPPDLSLTAREHDAAWIYSYLMSFYIDSARPTGVNNVVLPNASMPHVLGDLQGWQRRVEHEGGHEQHGAAFELVQPGSKTPSEYKEFVGDITNFLMYAAEPGRSHRMAVGVGVLIFVVIFWGLAYLLKVEYWKDVH